MAAKHLFYVTAARLGTYALQRDALIPGPSFPADETGYAAFSDYLHSLRSGLVYLLADVVEEDFHVEVIPYLRGNNRRQIIARRSAQRYRDTSLALSMSLGIERNERRDERILLAAITNTGLLQPWLNVIRERGLPLVGVYTIALAAAALLKRVAPKENTALLVSLEPGGLRETLVQANRLRFSRLGPIDPADAEQPARVAAAFAAETLRIHQYLVAVRALPREGGPLTAILLAPPGRSALLAAAVSDTAQIHYHVVDTQEAASRVGLKKLPPGAGSEALFLYVLAKQTPARQYAQEPQRRGYRLWQTRAALLAGSAIVFAACALGAMIQRVSINDLRSQIDLQQDLAQSQGAEYARVTRNFPKVPTTSENLRAAVTQFVSLARSASAPEPMLSGLSKAMDESPHVEVDRLRWQGAVAPAESAALAVPASNRAGKAADQKPPVYDTLEIDGVITGVPNSDYRTINALVSDFAGRLQARAKLVILESRLPFDVASKSSLSGGTQNVPDERPASFHIVAGTPVAP
jgi:hypothetical protein